jgi:hypothetical protein
MVRTVEKFPSVTVGIHAFRISPWPRAGQQRESRTEAQARCTQSLSSPGAWVLPVHWPTVLQERG